MDEYDKRIYRWELREQIDFVRMAHGMVGRALADRNTDELWFAIDAVIASMTRVANLLWPSKRQSKPRARELRAALGVAAVEAPKGLRDARNGFEHFDERIDTWRAQTTRRIFVDRHMNDLPVGVDRVDVARHYDERTTSVSVFGVATNLAQAYEEVEGIAKLIRSA